MEKNLLDQLNDIVNTDDTKEVREYTIMSQQKVRIYPDGSMYLGTQRAWIQENRFKPKRKPKKKTKLKEAKIEGVEEY